VGILTTAVVCTESAPLIFCLKKKRSGEGNQDEENMKNNSKKGSTNQSKSIDEG